MNTTTTIILALTSTHSQDIGILGGDYEDFDRSWYATVGVAVATTMLINVVVPHVQPLLG